MKMSDDLSEYAICVFLYNTPYSDMQLTINKILGGSYENYNCSQGLFRKLNN
jgi:hypothetical protein